MRANRANPAPVAAWRTLFVLSASPGAVFRFLERRGSGEPPGLLLSEAALGAEPWRALVWTGPSGDTAAGAQTWMEATGPVLAAAFPLRATLLFANDAEGAWGWRVWEASAPTGGPAKLTERGEGALPSAPTLVRRLAGLARAQSPTTLAVAWANARGLPASGIPTLVAGSRRQNVPRIAYETVAGLDARGLLREDGPRWYEAGRPPNAPTV